MRKHFFFIIVLFSLIVSCQTNYPDEISNTLQKTWWNKNEILKVYNHFKESGDSLKLKAAIFLINNLPEHYSYDSSKFEKYDVSFKMLGKRRKNLRGLLIDSLTKVGLWPQYSEASYETDLETVTSDFLIDNIESSFEIWNKAPWKEKYSFNQFCEFILPYKIARMPNSLWRRQLYQKYHNLYNYKNLDTCLLNSYSRIFNETQKDFISGGRNNFFADISLKNLERGMVGTCSDQCHFNILKMRSIGIPVVYDFIPKWGNSNGGHSWVSLVMPDSSLKYHLHNEKIPAFYKNYVHAQRVFESDGDVLTYCNFEKEGSSISPIINSGIFNTHLVPIEDLPENILVQTEKKGTKVYRDMFSRQTNTLFNLSVQEKEDIPDFFKNIHLKDVTNEYYNTFDVSLTINPYTKKFAYLCVFSAESPSSFVPVQWSIIDKGGIVNFKNMVPGNIYFPMFYDNEKLISAGYPVLLNESGKIETIKTFNKDIEEAKILLKYPLSLRMAFCASRMIGGKFQGSNNPDFTNYKDLFTVHETPFYWTEATTNVTESFRYVRFIGEKEKCDIAEIEFFEKNNTKLVPLDGKVLSFKRETQRPPENAFDDNMESYSGSPNGWVGLDFGVKRQISKIRFCPRNNSNMINVGNKYELYYWDGVWKPLGEQIAVKNFLLFKNVPKNAILWLRNKSAGHEERIFTYKEGKQIWW